MQRFPGIKEGYQQIEDGMRALVSKERSTPNPNMRTQISVTVIERNVTGIEADVRVNEVWNQLLDAGASLNSAFARFSPSCGVSEQELRSHGALQAAVEAWRMACRNILAEKAKFDPVFGLVTEKMVELKVLQRDAQRRRRTLMDEARSLQ
jgi:hypothetical protein